jgi:imidazolonepropionase-like amidohydrolase
VRRRLGAAIDVGVAVLAGTDLAVPHGAVAAEALRLADYGLTPEQALHAVADGAYDYLGVPHGFEPGMTADAVLVAADPGRDLRVLRRPRLVMRRGRPVVGELPEPTGDAGFS